MALVEVSGLVKAFPRRQTLWTRADEVKAVNGVSFAMEAGEVFGLVGESGSGKTTLGRCLLRLVEPTAGTVLFGGESVMAATPTRLRLLRRQMQMVFQDPTSSLNPRMRAGDIVAEPLHIHGVGTPRERHARVTELFELVGLDPAQRSRLPHEFSGGQRQRLAIARALALRPSFIVADEPVSALDVSIQAQVLNLLMDLQERLGLTLLFISHDLRVVRHVCTRVAVMRAGRVVEMGLTSEVFGAPAHEYTRALIAAIPEIRGAGIGDRVQGSGFRGSQVQGPNP